MLQSSVPKVPPVYATAEELPRLSPSPCSRQGREAFWVDAGTYLVASLASRGTGRWPPLSGDPNIELSLLAFGIRATICWEQETCQVGHGQRAALSGQLKGGEVKLSSHQVVVMGDIRSKLAEALGCHAPSLPARMGHPV